MNQLKTHLSAYIPELLKGKSIILCRRNEPIAEIVGLKEAGKKTRRKREIGFAKGRFQVSDAFLEPLSDKEIAAFEGEDR